MKVNFPSSKHLRRTPPSATRWTLLLVAVPLLIGACTRTPQAEEREVAERQDGLDDAVGRKRWLDAWFGGAPSSDYLAYKNRVAAAELERLVRSQRQRAAAGPAWTNLGPLAGASDIMPPDDASSADSGRLTAIVVHPTNPQIVYVAASEGGVFRSTNASLTATTDWTWTSLTDNLPASSSVGNISVGDLAMSPTDPNTLFLGLGDPLQTQSKGFFITSDGGTTWTAGGTLGATTQIWKILPLDATTLLVGTNSGLWRSTDAGKTFSEVALGGKLAAGAKVDIESVVRFAGGTVVVNRDPSDGSTAGIFYSTNAGASWTAATVTIPSDSTLARTTIATGGTGSTVAYGLAQAWGSALAGLLKSTDSGHTWSVVTPSGNAYDLGQLGYNQLVAVDPDNASHVWVGTQLGLYRSLDSGVTWTPAANNGAPWSHADFHVATWSKSGTKTLYLGNDGGLSLLRDPLRTTIPSPVFPPDFTYLDNRRNRGLATHLVYNLGSTAATTPADARYRVSIGTQDNGARLRTDPSGTVGPSSTTFDVGIGGDGFGTVYHPNNGNLVLGSYQNTVLKSSDGGKTWAQVNSTPFTGDPLVFGTVLVADRSDATGNGVLTVGSHTVYRSHDFGDTFTALPATTVGALYSVAVARTNGNVIAAVGEGSTSGGSSASPGMISTNGGTTWSAMGSAIATGTGARYAWFDTNNASVLYVTAAGFSATAHHLFKSIDQGKTFTPIDGSATASNGLPFGLPVYVVQNDPTSSSILYAGTDLGLYRSADGGASWARYGTGLPLVAVRDLWVAPDGTLIRVATYGRGVWELGTGAVVNTVTAAITAPAADLSVATGTTVAFTATAADSASGQTLTTSWSFCDGTSATGLTASHTFTNTTAAATTCTVTFTATDTTGASGSVSRTVTVTPGNTFTVAVQTGITGFLQVAQGASVSATVNTAVASGSAQSVALSVSGALPAGVTAQFSPTSVTAGSSATLTLTASASAPAGSYPVTVLGTGASSSATGLVSLHVLSTQVITNGDFESGTLNGWTSAGTTSVGKTGHAGAYAAVVGSTAATNGDSSIAQTFTAPAAGGTLSFWYDVHCPDTVSYDWATATLKDNTAGTSTTVLAKTCNNANTWKQVTAQLTGGHGYTLTLVSHDDNAAGDPTYTWFDDVAVTATVTPPPVPLTNGTFETGSLSGWTSVGSTSVGGSAHGGSYAAVVGLVGKATSGDSSIAQTFSPASSGTLSFWVNVHCKDTVTYDWATATLKDVTAGTSSTVLAKTCTNSNTWKQVSAAVTGGHSYTLTLVNHDDNSSGDETYTQFDDVAVQ